MAISRDQIERWGNAPSENEESKCQKTVEQIKEIIRGRFGNGVFIYLQGSYKNRTNVRAESDVDIVVENPNYYFPNTYSLNEDEKRKFEAAFSPATYPFENFKSDIHLLLQNKFGTSYVQRNNKCIKVGKDTSRVNADVVPCYTYKRFSSATAVEAEGIAFADDSNGVIDSFPKQHYENGASKNLGTDGKFKKVVRALKNARNDLIDVNQIQESLMRSFFLECLVWNVPNADFNSGDLYDTTRQIIARIWEDLGNIERAKNYAEISDLKWLLRGSDAETKKQNAKDFLQKAWNYIGN